MLFVVGSAGTAFRQLLQTASDTSRLVCDSSTSNPDRQRQLCRGAGLVSKGSRLEAWMKSHKSEVAVSIT